MLGYELTEKLISRHMSPTKPMPKFRFSVDVFINKEQ